jgi:hypothetical protein
MAYSVLRFDDNEELCFDGEQYRLREIAPPENKRESLCSNPACIAAIMAISTAA